MQNKMHNKTKNIVPTHLFTTPLSLPTSLVYGDIHQKYNVDSKKDDKLRQQERDIAYTEYLEKNKKYPFAQSSSKISSQSGKLSGSMGRLTGGSIGGNKVNSQGEYIVDKKNGKIFNSHSINTVVPTMAYNNGNNQIVKYKNVETNQNVNDCNRLISTNEIQSHFQSMPKTFSAVIPDQDGIILISGVLSNTTYNVTKTLVRLESNYDKSDKEYYSEINMSFGGNTESNVEIGRVISTLSNVVNDLIFDPNTSYNIYSKRECANRINNYAMLKIFDDYYYTLEKINYNKPFVKLYLKTILKTLDLDNLETSLIDVDNNMETSIDYVASIIKNIH